MTFVDLLGSFFIGLGLFVLALAVIAAYIVWRVVGAFAKQIRALPTWGFLLFVLGFGVLLFVEDAASIVTAGISIIPAVVTAAGGGAVVYHRLKKGG